MTQPLRRMRDFVEIMDAERAAILNLQLTRPDATMHPVYVKATKALCGATLDELFNWCNEASDALSDREERGELISAEEWDRACELDSEREELIWPEDSPRPRCDADVLNFYQSIGWDPTNEHGQVLLVAANLVYPFAAASKAAGPARFPEEGAELALAWGEKLAARSKRPLTETPPITDEERRRRNAEASKSTVWRPNLKKGHA